MFSLKDHDSKTLTKQIVGTCLLTGVVGVGGFLASRYKICRPNQYMVKTGFGIKDMSVSKKGIVFPFQKYQMIDMNPRSYSFELHNMSKEMVPFNLPVVFTISPSDPTTDLELFKNYARSVSNASDYELETTVRSIFQGESRILSAGLTIEQMFNDKEMFKNTVTNNIQEDLKQFGLRICNANIEEMKDLDENKYFFYRKQKALEGSNNAARVEVAEAKKIGDIGEKERLAETRQRVAQIEAETIRVENTRDRDMAESNKDLNVAKSEFIKQEQLAKIEAEMAADQRKLELQKEVEMRRAQQELESLRARDLVAAKVSAESCVQKAEGESQAKKIIADAELYSETKRAEGLQRLFDVQAHGVSSLLNASSNNPQLVQFYLAMNSGLYTDLAKHSAAAIQGLEPKINIWNTGNNNDSDDPFKSLRDIVKVVPPMFDVLKQQTDIKIPFVKQ